MGKIKQPKLTQGNKVSVSPSSGESTNKLRPRFCFEHLSADYSVESCSQEDRAAFAVQLSKLGSMTWAEIQNAPRHGLGHEKISRTSIRGSIPRSVTPDVEFIAFRFSGKKPMVGFRSGQIFHIIWLDKNFDLYNH